MDDSTDLLADKVLLTLLAAFVVISTTGAIKIADLKAQLAVGTTIQTASLER